MKKAKQCLIALLPGVLLTITVLSGCGQSQKAVSKNDDHLTVYLWENRLMKNIVPYIHEQFPDQDIEFITGNNDTDLYSYFEEHGELPDIITVRRFSGKDAQDLEPYLMDFASYDVVSRYYSYALGQFTRNYTQTVKRAADNKRRYAPGWVHSTCLLRGFPKGAAPHLAHDFAEQSVVCYTLCRRCPENTVAAGEGKGI